MTEKSTAQRALDANFPASRLAQELHAAYWLASCNEDLATYMAASRMREAEECFCKVGDALGYRVEKIEPVAADQREVA